MDRIRQIIEEIRELEKEPTHRSSLRIYSLLDNNSRLFLGKMDADDFRHQHSAFEALTDKSPVEYGTAAYKEEFQRRYQALAFYLNRII
jgi:hypothetical protein